MLVQDYPLLVSKLPGLVGGAVGLPSLYWGETWSASNCGVIQSYPPGFAEICPDGGFECPLCCSRKLQQLNYVQALHTRRRCETGCIRDPLAQEPRRATVPRSYPGPRG